MHHRRPVSLPLVKSNNVSYTLHSISLAKEGCYDQDRGLKIDGGYGDYNMKLFRFRERLKFVRDIPSAFTSSIKQSLEYRPEDSKEEMLIADHNDEIDKILSQPKEVYLQKIRKEKELEEKRQAEWNKAHQYILGEDRQVREYNEQLTFNYLPKHQANQWFKIKDYSASYVPPQPPPIGQPHFSTPKLKPKRRKGHIFLSDDRNNRIFQKQ